MNLSAYISFSHWAAMLAFGDATLYFDSPTSGRIRIAWRARIVLDERLN